MGTMFFVLMLLSFSKAMQRYELFPNLQTFDKKNYRKSMFLTKI